jgi:hypothetical protein
MRSSAFTIETRGQGEVIFGGTRSLEESLVQEFLLTGIQAIAPEGFEAINQFHQSHDLDYLLFFPTH